MKKRLLAVLLSAACVTALAAPTDDMRTLLEQNKPREAYALGKTHEDMLGDPLFDFWFGIAALDAGSPGEGVLALERYALHFPDNRSGRFHLGRGYYILGEDQRARDEFENLRPNATGEEKVAIERYLDAIRARESRYLPTANAWVEAGLGYDSNLNSGVKSNSAVTIPDIITFRADPNSISTKESDYYFSAGTGVQGTMPVAPGVALFGSLALNTRNYFSSNNRVFDQQTYGGNGGVSVLFGKNLYRAGLGITQQVVDSQNYLATYGLFGEWSHQFDQFDRISLGASYGRHDYSDIDVYATKDRTGGKRNSGSSLRTDDYWGFSANWTHVFGIAWQPVLGLSAAYQREENQRDRDDFSRDIYNLRAQISFTPAPKWGLMFGLGYMNARHDKIFGNLPIGEKRKDRNLSADMAVAYHFNKSWSARFEAQASDQHSNIELFDHSRWSVASKLRYEFN